MQTNKMIQVTRVKEFRQIFLLSLVVGATLPLIGCASAGGGSNTAADREKVEKELGGEVSLKADRDQFSELRAEIPQEKQKENDELALILNVMGEGKENPQALRDKFQNIVQKRRTRFRDKVSKIRENYKKEETKLRDQFLEKSKKSRAQFVKSKHDSKATREFFAEQDKERGEYFAEERERRQNFESEVRVQSKDFDSYMRERTNEFNEQMRMYTKKFYDRSGDKKAVTGESTGDDFSEMNKVPATPLGTGGSGN